MHYKSDRKLRNSRTAAFTFFPKKDRYELILDFGGHTSFADMQKWRAAYASLFDHSGPAVLCHAGGPIYAILILRAFAAWDYFGTDIGVLAFQLSVLNGWCGGFGLAFFRCIIPVDAAWDQRIGEIAGQTTLLDSGTRLGSLRGGLIGLDQGCQCDHVANGYALLSRTATTTAAAA